MIHYLFFTVFLIPGTAESIPNTEDYMFHVFTSPDIVEDVVSVPDERLSLIMSSGSTEDSLSIKIPKNLPMWATREGTTITDTIVLVIADDREVESKMIEHECFVERSISIQNPARVDLLYGVILVGEPFITSNLIDEACLGSAFAERGATEPAPPGSIPAWVKTSAGEWAAGTLDDESFAKALLHLVYTGTLDPQEREAGADRITIPEWTKYNARWWADGAIDDDSFVNALQYVVWL